MGIFRDILWQKPHARVDADNDAERKVTFLELFYDLAFVICIATIVHPLIEHPTFAALGRYALLFVPIFWAWLNGALYHDLHAAHDLKTRLYTLIQMLLIAAIAIYSEQAFDLSGAIFPLVLAAQYLFVALLSWRTAKHNPRLRLFYHPFILFTFAGVLLLALSALVNSEWRYLLWGAAFFLIIFKGTLAYMLNRKKLPKFRLSSSLRERFGLFTIIILGEMLFAIIDATGQIEHRSAAIVLLSIAGVVMTLSVWWIYFDYLGFGKVAAGATTRWHISHALLTMSIPVLGAGIFQIILADATAHISALNIVMISGSVTMILIAAKIIMSILDPQEDQKEATRPLYQMAQWTLSTTLAVTLLLAFMRWRELYDGAAYLLLTALSLLIPVVIGVRIWVHFAKMVRRHAAAERSDES